MTNKLFLKSLLFALTLVGSFPATAGNGVPLLLPFQGRATDTSGNPINYAATFKFRVYPPAGSCYIYEDTQSITPNTYGFFSVVLGTGSNSTGPANSLSTIFSNENGVTDSCAATYSPASGDWRRLEIIVDGVPMPTMQTISASAFAINTQLFDGKNSTAYLQVNGPVNQGNLSTLVDGSDASALHHHDGRYIKIDGSTPFTGGVTTSGNFIGTSSSSQIGVGTSSPGADIEIQKTNPSLRMEAASGGGGTQKLEFFSGSTERARIQSSETTNELRFFTGSTEAMRLDAASNMIIAGSLDVAGTVSLGQYTDAQETVLVGILTGMGASALGAVWVNSTSNAIKYWDGSSAVALGSGGGAVASVYGRTGAVTAQSNDYTWAQVDKTTSSLADLTTRSATDLSSGTLSDARLSTNIPLKNGANAFTNANTITVATTTDEALVLKSSDDNMTNNIVEVRDSSNAVKVSIRPDGVPTATTDLTSKTYVDTGLANKLNLSGGTMSGQINMGSTKIVSMANPTAAQDAATKTYVDSNLATRAVVSTAPTNGQVLVWNNGATQWEPQTPPSAPVSSVYGRTGAVVAASNDYTWAQVDKTTSSLADLTTRSATDLSSGTLGDARLSTNVPLKNGANAFTAANTITVATTTDKALVLKSTDDNMTNNIIEVRDSANALKVSVRPDGVPTAATDLTTKTYVDTKLATRTVVTTAPTNGQVLVWNNGATQWEPQTPPSAPVSSVYGRTGAVVAVSNDYTWAQVDKTTSSLADLTTRSATDLSSGTLSDARLSTNIPLKNGANAFTAANTITVATTTDKALVLKSSDDDMTNNIIEVRDSANALKVSVRPDGVPTAATDLTTKTYADTKLATRTVVTTAPTNGQVLVWNNGASQWEPQTPPSAPVSSVYGRTGAVVAAANDYTWAQVDKTTSSIADLTTRSATDLSSGTLSDARLSTNVPLKNGANAFTNANTITVATTTDEALVLKSSDDNMTNNIVEVRDSSNAVKVSVRPDGVPTATTDLTTKTYVDTGLANKLSLSGGTMSGQINMGSTKIVSMANPTAAQDAATKTYVDSNLATRTVVSTAPTNGQVLVWNNGATQWEPQTPPSAPVSSVYGRTGAVVAASNDYTWAQVDKTTSSLADLTTRSATDISSGTLGDARLSTNVPLKNGANAFTNANTITVATTTDEALVLKSSDDNMTNNIVEVRDSANAVKVSVRPDGVPTAATDLTTKTYVDAGLANKLNLSGGTMSGQINMGSAKIVSMANPTAAQDAATKTYVDSNLATRAVVNTAPTNGQVMTWNNGATQWEPQAPPSAPVSSVYGRTGAVVAASNDYTWAQVDKTTSSLADLTTRSASDISSGTLTDARLSSNVPLKNGANAFTTANTITVATTTDKALVLKSSDDNMSNNIVEVRDSANALKVSVRPDGVPTATTDLTTKTYVDTKLATRTVASTAPTNGQIMTWNNGATQWEPQAPPSAPVSSVYGRTGAVVAASNDYTWAQVDKTTSSIADLTTRSATDLSSGTLADGRLSTNVPLKNGANAFTNANTITVATTTDEALVLKSSDDNMTNNIVEIRDSANAVKVSIRPDGVPTATTDLTTKTYVDTALTNKLNLSGGTMSGQINMGSTKIVSLANPTAAQDAATKTYVDSNLATRAVVATAPTNGQVLVWNNGATQWEPQTPPSAPVSSVYGRTGAVVAVANDYTWAQVDKTTSSLADLTTRSATDLSSGTLSDGRLSTNIPLKNGANAFTNANTITVATTTDEALVLKSSDDNMTNNIVEVRDSTNAVKVSVRPDGVPTATTDLTTKSFVDSGLGLKLNLTGGTMSGQINMGSTKIVSMANPTAAQDAATKTYVDSNLATRAVVSTAPTNGQVMTWNNGATQWEPQSLAAAPVSSVYGRTGAVVAASNDYTWAQVDKTTSSLADLTTRSATDLSSGTLADARLSSNVPLKNGANAFTAANTITVATTSDKALVLKSSDDNTTNNIVEVRDSANALKVSIRPDGVPTANTDLTTKTYVDTKLATRTLVTTAPTNGQVMTWNNGATQWEPQSLPAAPVSSVYGRTGAVVAASNDYTWAQVDKTTSSLADLTTRSATDLSSGTLGDARLSTNVPIKNGANAFTNANTITVATTTDEALVLKSSDDNMTNNIVEVRDSGNAVKVSVRPDGVPTATTDLTTKTYVDTGLATKLNLSGGTLSGQLSTSVGTFQSTVADGAAANAFALNTSTAYTTAGAMLISLQNNSVEKFTVDKDGVVAITAPGTGLAVTNDATVGGTLTVTGATTLSSTVAVTGVGTFTAGAKMKNAGAGSTTLDHYEEGTFTPTYAGTTTPGTCTYTASQLGSFVRIGKLVMFTIRLAWTACPTAPAGAPFLIAGLPYASKNTANLIQTIGIVHATTAFTVTAGNHLVGRILPNTSTIQLKQLTAVAGATATTDVASDVAADISISGTYEVQ